MGSSRRKKIKIILLVAFLLLISPLWLIYIPGVQRWAVREVSSYLADETGMEISMDRLGLTFLFDLDIRNLKVEDQQHTVVSAKRVVIDLSFSRIFLLQMGIDAIDLREVSLDSGDMIDAVTVEGQLSGLSLNKGLTLFHSKALSVEDFKLQGANLRIALHDTPPDTTTSAPIPWHLVHIDKLNIQDSRLHVTLPGDTLSILADVRRMMAEGGKLYLHDERYEIAQIELDADTLTYDCLNAPMGKGFDYQHIHLSEVRLKVDSLLYQNAPMFLQMHLTEAGLNHSDDFLLQQLSGVVRLSENDIQVDSFMLLTPSTEITGNLRSDFDAFKSHQNGLALLNLKTKLSREDFLWLGGSYLPEDLKKAWPKGPMTLNVTAEGNVDSMKIEQIGFDIPQVLNLQMTGELGDLAGSDLPRGHLMWDVKTRDLSSFQSYLGLDDLRFPPMVLHASTFLKKGNTMEMDALLTEGEGRVKVQGEMDVNQMRYSLIGKINNLNPQHFYPSIPTNSLTAAMKVNGKGTDIFSPQTSLNSHIRVMNVSTPDWALNDLDLRLSKSRDSAKMDVGVNDSILSFYACADALLKQDKVDLATFNLDLNRLDLYAFGLHDSPMSLSMVMHTEGETDLKENHHLTGNVNAIVIHKGDSTYYSQDIHLDALLTPNNLAAYLKAGDLTLRAESPQNIDQILSCGQNLWTNLQTQLDSLYIDQDTLRTMLPDLSMTIEAGKKNVVNNFMRASYGSTFDTLHIRLNSSPQNGLNGDGQMLAFRTKGVVIDSTRFHIVDEVGKGLGVNAQVKNGPKNKSVSFDTRCNAYLTPTGAKTQLLFYDGKGRKGLDLGFELTLLSEGIRAHFVPLVPIVAYRKFTLNEDNFIQLDRDGHLEALVDLLADDGTGLKLYTIPNEEALQDISLSLNRFNVGELMALLPYAPDVQGLLHGDFHYMQTDSVTTTISADMAIRKLTYQGVGMGDLGLNGIYFPNADGSHFVDAILTRDNAEIMTMNGKLFADNTIDATAQLNRLPLDLANAFLPQGLMRLEGYAMGELAVGGKTDVPVIDGNIITDSMHVISDDYSVNLTIPNDTINIEKSVLNLNRIEAYAAGKQPLSLDGHIDFSHPDNVQLSLNMLAKNYTLMDAPKSKHALAYGKVFVDISAYMWGTLDDLKMRGRLDVLGNTDATYVLKDSPLTVQDHMADIVEFVDFSDTVAYEPIEVKNQAVDMMMEIQIDQGVQLRCLLSDDGSDFVTIQGGGNLTLNYDLQNELRMWGRYSIESGMMRYSLMAIPLNDFSIKSGSYVEFQGDVENPRLSIQATERVKAAVTENDVPRNVAFDVGLSISQTLDNMGLEFTISSEDLSVQNQLSGMSPEDRGRLAVTMLVTGMYIDENFSIKNGFSYANTLNAYLQGAINRIAGNALETVDLNLGIESGTSATGSTTTDYSFNFAKRFWGNRIRLIIGGKVSSGEDAVNTGQTIIDNVSVEYRLDKSATRYVNVFYERDKQSLLEEEVIKMGGGIVLRRRSSRLRDLFRFRQKKTSRESTNISNGTRT